ncbi:MAG: putative cysteine desulfurase [Chlamydiales bacterium]|nr:putative cysteine desulfurase [Chlamydiales bacterium]MCH9619693.1 putative cysteine desulfurase [Chlamydiales bacterium]MCH9623299.1 putative cysteine desulfurase [Chlamydiales bacterium]
MKPLLDLRTDFPMLKQPMVYFDSAATALTPHSVIDAMSDFYRNHYGTVHRAIYKTARKSTEQYHLAREKVARFLGAKKSEEIIFTRGTTASLNLLARSFGETFIQPGDVIIVSEIEHHSNLIPWQMMAKREGAILRFIPVNEKGELILEAFDKLLDENVKLVSIPHISNSTGTVHPIETIIEKAHEYGAFVSIDGAQSAPHLPIDVQELDVDFFAFSGHKLYGPTGIGVLYGKEAILNEMIPIEGGGDMIDQVSLEESSYATLPLKFEAGTPMTCQAIGLAAAIDYVTEIGMETIWEEEQKLLAYATEKLTPLVKIIGTAEHKGAILSFVHSSIHPLDLTTLLDCRGFALRSGHHCSQPMLKRFGVSSTARISFGLYNTTDEIDRFIETLESVIGSLV